MINFKAVENNRYEMLDDIGQRLIHVVTADAKDGTHRVVAAIDGRVAEEIKSALAIYDALKFALR